jgi:hypothetical protein
MDKEHVAMTSDKTRENRARRMLAKFGFQLKKSPTRSWERQYYGPGYMILRNNWVKWGCSNRQWDMTLDEVEAIAADSALLEAKA